ncbi:MAG: hypothetical protein AABZ11_02930, partial [Nitrospinota bacterium]
KLITYKNALFKTMKGYLFYPLAMLMTVVLSVVGISTIFILSLRALAKQSFFSATLAPLRLLRRFAPRNNS